MIVTRRCPRCLLPVWVGLHECGEPLEAELMDEVPIRRRSEKLRPESQPVAEAAP
jgi:hypothetical protein